MVRKTMDDETKLRIIKGVMNDQARQDQGFVWYPLNLKDSPSDKDLLNEYKNYNSAGELVRAVELNAIAQSHNDW